MVAKKEKSIKSKSENIRSAKSVKTRKSMPARRLADEWNTLTAFRNFARCVGFSLLAATPLVAFKIFPSLSFGLFDMLFAILGLGAFFGSGAFILFTVYGGREPYQSTHTVLNAIFGMVYVFVSTFGVVALLTLTARQPDMLDFYGSFTSAAMQYVKMMPVFGIFIGLSLSYAYPRLFTPKEAKKTQAREERKKAKPKSDREKAAPLEEGNAALEAQDDREM